MGIHVIWVLALLAGCKKNAPAPPAPPPPATFEDRLETWTAEIVPLLEQHANRRFQTPPVVEIFDQEHYRDYVRRELVLVMEATLRDTPPQVRKKAADAQSGLISVFGKYGLFDKKTYVVPEVIERTAAEQQISADDLARVVLAHELTHALQNDTIDAVEPFGSLVDLDHFRCWSSVSEGGANLLALAVARDLGIEEAFWTVAKNQGWDQNGLVNPAAYSAWMSYGRGMAALDAVVQAEGMAGFWRWHEQPPIRSSMLFAPETWSPDLAPSPIDFASVLRGTEQLLTRGEWLVSNSRLGEYELRGDAIRTGKEEAFDKVLRHLLFSQHLDLEMSGGGRKADIRVLRFDSAEAADSYVTLLRAEQTVEGQFLAKTLKVTVEVTYAEVKGVEGDRSLLRTQRIPTGDGRYHESRTAWVARGPDIVAVTAEGFRPGLRLANTLNGVFERLDESQE